MKKILLGVLALALSAPAAFAGTGSVYMDRMNMGHAFYLQASSTTITNSTATVSIFNNTITHGSRTITANYWRPAKILHITTRSLLSTAASAPTGSITIKLGGTTIYNSTETLPSNLTNMLNESNISVVCTSVGTSGKVTVIGDVITTTTIGLAAPVIRKVFAQDVVVDTTKSMVVDVFYTFGTASTSNTLKVYSVMLEWR